MSSTIETSPQRGEYPVQFLKISQLKETSPQRGEYETAKKETNVK